MMRLWLAGTLGLILALNAFAANRDVAYLLEIKGTIGPALSDYLARGLVDAEAADARFVIITMDTPGGLASSTRDMTQAILAAKIPVIVYVAPEGAQAASAGTYLLYAAHIAAMAPATNVGAATPVSMNNPLGGAGEAPASEPSAMEKKQVNDAVAQIKSLAQLRGRNVEWAEAAVREGASLSAQEAYDQGVVEILADNMDQLIMSLNGRVVQIQGQAHALNTSGLRIVRQEADWRSRFLAIIANPNLAYILMMIGIYGLIFEFYNPGVSGSGILGAICLLLAFYSFQILPINYVGLALIGLGVALMVAEAMNPSFGVLGLGGGVAFVIGSVILMDTDLPSFQIALPLIGGFAVASFFLFGFGISMAMKARDQALASGNESWIGTRVVALEDFQGRGHVMAQGERWRAECVERVAKGERLEIEEIEGLILKVKKLEGQV